MSLEAVIADVEDVRERFQWMPAAAAPAMAEMQAEASLAGLWRDQPVTETHQHAGFLLLAAEDHARAMCRLLRLPEPSIFAHVPMARAALEASALSYHLTDPTLSAGARLARYMTECLFSDVEASRFGGEAQARRNEQAKLIAAQAAAVGLQRVKSKKSTWSGRPRGRDEMLAGPTGRGRRLLIGAV